MEWKETWRDAALREAVINTIVHKEYSSGISIQIKVFENGIRIWNDVQFPTDWSLTNLFAVHKRNLQNLQKAKKIERIGSAKGGYWKVIE